MTKTHEELQKLYTQRKLLDERIAHLEKQLQEQSTKQAITKEERIELFFDLFFSRTDIYAKLWESQDGLKKRYYPVTHSFQGTDYIPINQEQVELHLRGENDLASYFLNATNEVKYIVLQCSIQQLEQLHQTLQSMGINALYELHTNEHCRVWVFFENLTQVKVAKDFAINIIRQSKTNASFMPKEDFANQANFGSIVALPLQYNFRTNNQRVFIDPVNKKVIKEPWQQIKNIQKVSSRLIEQYVDVKKIMTTVVNNDLFEAIVFPASLEVMLYDFIYIPSQHLDKSLLNQLKSFATFDNPQIKILQSLRKPLYNTPRTLKGYEEDENFLKLPRGLFDEVMGYLEENGVNIKLKDKRYMDEEVFPKMAYEPKEEQLEAIEAMQNYESCLCVAPPGFGKTFLGSYMIGLRACSTLVVVHKNMLLDQWIERFMQYFGLDKKEIGFLGKGKNKLNGKLDVATMQSLKNNPQLIENYAHVIVDECHHLPAVTFEQIIKLFRGKYILGLSATPNRKDGLDPIIFQQIGPIAYEHKSKRSTKNTAFVIRTQFKSEADSFTELINAIANDDNRNNLILEQIQKYKNRKILVLTDRIEHISNLEILLETKGIEYLSIHGSMKKNEQQENMAKVKDASLLLATASFFGEGIDFPHLDTIIFATPISYYGRLVQYLGRVGRGGADCIAIDLLDSNNAMLNSTFKKRKSGYTQMHYKISFE